MQLKIPQEVNVEDKVIGPFTVKAFGFIFTFCILCVLFTVAFIGTGIGFTYSLTLGVAFSSPALIVGFVPFNGRPLYTYAPAFMNFFLKPRQRIWKKTAEDQKQQAQKEAEEKAKAAVVAQKEEEESYVPSKVGLETADETIEEISLMVDTGGVYGGVNQTNYTQNGPTDIFDQRASSGQIDSALNNARQKVEANSPTTEPKISELATMDPDKRYEYHTPDTSKYELDTLNNKGGKQK